MQEKSSLFPFNLLSEVQRRLGPQQKFVTAGGFDGSLKNKAPYVTSSTAQPQPDDSLYCNAEESDTRIWNSAGTKKLVLSPDTDVYHIGLPTVAGTDLECCPTEHVQHHRAQIVGFTGTCHSLPE